MTLKIAIACDGETATFRLSGCIEQDHLAALLDIIEMLTVAGLFLHLNQSAEAHAAFHG